MLKLAKSDEDRKFIQLKIDAFISVQNENTNIPDEEITEAKEDLKVFTSPFGKVVWNKDEKTIECQGAIFTENEMLEMQKAGIGITDFDIEIKKQFSDVRLKIKENGNYTN